MGVLPPTASAHRWSAAAYAAALGPPVPFARTAAASARTHALRAFRSPGPSLEQAGTGTAKHCHASEADRVVTRVNRSQSGSRSSKRRRGVDRSQPGVAARAGAPQWPARTSELKLCRAVGAFSRVTDTAGCRKFRRIVARPRYTALPH